jgi:hypothetical protein
MAIRSYNTKADYEAAVKPTTESQVSLIESSREVIVDGVNVITTEPVVGDALFLDESNNKVFVKGGDWLQKAVIPSAWTFVGVVFSREGRRVGIIDKDGDDEKYADVLQFELTGLTLDGAEHSATIGLRLSNNYNTNTTITFTYATTLLSEVVTALNAAIDAKQVEVGFTNTVWAYLINDKYEKVETDEDATSIMVQIDVWSNENQTAKSNSGCTLTFVTWRDMPASSVYFRANNRSTDTRGIMNIDKAESYFTTEGRTPTDDVVLPEANVAPLSKTAFETSPYCEQVRAEYATYRDYLLGEYLVKIPQKYGTFALPSGKELSDKYASLLAPTKAGDTKAMFPSFYRCYNIDYNAEGLRKGDWYLPGCEEGCKFMASEIISKMSPTMSKMGGTGIGSGTYRWFAQRNSGNRARYFYRNYGFLGSTSVQSRYRRQAVALLII